MIAAIGLIAATTGILTFALGNVLSPLVRTIGGIASGILLVGLAAFYTGKGIVRLAQEGEKLATELQSCWKQVEELNKEKAAWQNQGDKHRQGSSVAGALFGLLRYRYSEDCYLGQDGSWKLKGFTSMTALIPGISAIEHFVTAPHASADWDAKITLHGRDEDDQSVLVEPRVLERTDERLYWQVRVIPMIQPGHRIEYSYETSLPAGTFGMTPEHLRDRGLDWEFWSTRITIPTERLTLCVTMPPKFRLEEYDCDVWFTSRSRIRHSLEYHRLTENGSWKVTRLPEGERLQLQLEVTNPIQGLYYTIKWRPEEASSSSSLLINPRHSLESE